MTSFLISIYTPCASTTAVEVYNLRLPCCECDCVEKIGNQCGSDCIVVLKTKVLTSMYFEHKNGNSLAIPAQIKVIVQNAAYFCY